MKNIIAHEPGFISVEVDLSITNVKNKYLPEHENELEHLDFNWFANKEVTNLMREDLIPALIIVITLLINKNN